MAIQIKTPASHLQTCMLHSVNRRRLGHPPIIQGSNITRFLQQRLFLVSLLRLLFVGRIFSGFALKTKLYKTIQNPFPKYAKDVGHTCLEPLVPNVGKQVVNWSYDDGIVNVTGIRKEFPVAEWSAQGSRTPHFPLFVST